MGEPRSAPCWMTSGGQEGYEAAKTLLDCADHLAAAPTVPLPEDLLLDVGIRPFAMPAADGAADELRRAEGAYLAGALRAALQAMGRDGCEDAAHGTVCPPDSERAQGHWGAVRVVSRPSAAIDLAVVARVERSDGETLALRVRATDARGMRWLDKRYRSTAEPAGVRKRASREGAPRKQKPFGEVFRAVASDLTARLLATPHDELRAIRAVAELRFADGLAPGALAGYLEDSDGLLAVRRLPAEEDPLLGLAGQVRNREHMFIDTVDEYFRGFEHRVGARYSRWRRASLDSAAAQRSLLAEAEARELLGAIHVLTGLADGERTAAKDPAASGRALRRLLDGTGLMAVALRKREAVAAEAAAARTEAAAAGIEMLPATLALENSAATLAHRVAQEQERAGQALASLHRRTTGRPLPAQPLPQPRHFAPIAEHQPSPAHDAATGPARAEAVTDHELPPFGASLDEALTETLARIEAGRLPEAFDALDVLLEAERAAAYNGRELAHVYSTLAFAHHRNGDVANASAALEAVVAQGGAISKARLAAASFSLAQLRFEQAQHALAWQALRQGLATADIQQTACTALCSPEARTQLAARASPAADGAGSCMARRSQTGRPRQLDVRFRQRLETVRGQIDAGEAAAALATIDEALADHPRGPERALLQRYKASAHSALGDQARAIQAYERMLDGPGFVPPGAEARTVYDLAHLHLAQGNYEQSLCYQREWLRRSRFPLVCKQACGR